MIEVGGVPGSRQVQMETDATEAAGTTRPTPAAVDTSVPSAVGMPIASASDLPPSQGPIDYGSAVSAVGAMSENVGVDFGRIAALMMMIDSELARAARDSQVEQIEEVAAEMHKSADDLRASAKMALVGGCVAGSMQIASAGITIAGGVKGMSLTTGSVAAEGEAPSVPVEETSTAPAEETSTAPAEETSAPATSSQAELGGGVEEPAPAQESAEETRQENVEEITEQETKAKQKAATKSLDTALSQQMSARAQNISLVTQGLSQVTSSTGEIIKSALDYESKLKEAKSKDDDAMAEEQRAYMERTKAFADAMQKGAQDMIQIYQQMTEGMHQTSTQVWSRA